MAETAVASFDDGFGRLLKLLVLLGAVKGGFEALKVLFGYLKRLFGW